MPVNVLCFQAFVFVVSLVLMTIGICDTLHALTLVPDLLYPLHSRYCHIADNPSTKYYLNGIAIVPCFVGRSPPTHNNALSLSSLLAFRRVIKNAFGVLIASLLQVHHPGILTT